MELGWVRSLLVQALAGAVGGLITTAGLWQFVGRWLIQRQIGAQGKELEALKANYATELEIVKADRQRQQNLLQVHLDHSIHVTRTHFETEFQTLKEIFALLAEARLHFAGIRPMVDYSTGDRAEDSKRLFARLDKFNAIHNDLISKTEALLPFYPENLATLLNECSAAMRMEIGQITSGSEADRFSPLWYLQGEQNRTKFYAEYTVVALAIRQRIYALSIIPGS